MLQGLLSCDSFCRILGDQFHYEVFGSERYFLPLPIIKLVFALCIFLQDFFRCLAFEKWSACQNDIEYDAHAKYISLAVVALVLKELWSNIARGSTAQSELVCGTLQNSGQPEIDNF